MRARAMAGAICVCGAWGMYLLINMFTKGYFTTPLRLSAAMITALAIFALV